jgi:ABC-type transport system involved in multi-copper enzyme maturation permease subunit
MLKMIKKDLIACRNGLLINMFILLVFAGVMFKIALLDMFMFVNIIYIVLVAITPITTEDKLKADPLTLSLPLTRKKIVGSRYLYALLAIIFMIVFIFVYGYVLNFFISSNNIDFSNALTFSRVFSIFFFTVVAVSFFIPFVYKFGQNGIMLGLGGTVLVSTIFFMVTAIGLRSEMMKKIIGGFFERIENGGLSNFFTSISQNMGNTLALVMLVGIMIVAVFLSMRLSMLIYARKEF